MAEKSPMKTGVGKTRERLAEVERAGNSVELAQTLRIEEKNLKQDNVVPPVAALINGEEIKSFADSGDHMPERYGVDEESLQNMNQV